MKTFWCNSLGRFITTISLVGDCVAGIHEADLIQDRYGEQHCKNCGRVLPRAKGEFGNSALMDKKYGGMP